MTFDHDELRRAYAAGLQAYISDGDEVALRTAYELGRTAVEQELTVLDLAAAHHDNLLLALSAAQSAADAERITHAAGDFFLESVSAFEMVRRGFREARDLALVERRHAAMLRQLSMFLGDASLALHTLDSVQEVLTLVAEQARELVSADCAVAGVRLGDDDREHLSQASFVDTDTAWASIVAELGASIALRPTGPLGGTSRLAGVALQDHPVSRVLWSRSNPPRTLRGWLAAPMTTLDGRELGSIQLFDKPEGDFTELDEAVLAHVARMASAAIERAQLYQRPR